MLLQFYFSEKVLPSLYDTEDGHVYKGFIDNQIFPIGNIVNDRQLVRCLTDEHETLIDFLDQRGKLPKVCGGRDIEGNWVIAKDQEEYDIYMQNGAVDNTSAGWLAFNEEKPVAEEAPI